MKRIILIMVVSSLLSCSKNTVDLNSYVTNRIWKERVSSGSQYYFFSDGYKYLWIQPDYNKYSVAEGNPISRPFPINGEAIGWKKSANYKIVLDSLFIQQISDLNGRNVHKQTIEIGKDTIIGIVKYNTLKVRMQGYLVGIWLSKEQSTKTNKN